MEYTSLGRKFMTCLVASLTTIAFLLVLGNSGTLYWFPPIAVFTLVGISFGLSLIYPFVWQLREKKSMGDSKKVYGWLYSIIRYTIAFNLAGFGWKKIFGLQFVVPADISGKPMNQQSGEWLTWYYFGYSFAFGIILAMIQILGAWFLLFRKTQLVAAIGLFAFMLNLTLINIFYHMNAGALLQSILLTLGISFLILLDYKRLVHFFFRTSNNLPGITVKSVATKNLVRASAILLSLLFTLYLKYIFLAR